MGVSCGFESTAQRMGTFLLSILPYYNTGFSPSISVITGLLFCGALGLLLLFSISFYLVNRNSKIYLYYGLFVLFSFTGGVINLQYDINLLDQQQEMGNTASLLLEMVTLLAFSAYSWFTNTLFDIKKQTKSLYLWIKYMANISVAYILLYAIFYPIIAPYEGLFFMISRSFVICMSVIAIIWLIVKIHSPIKAFFIIGSSWYFLGALFASIIQLVPNLPFEGLYSFRTTIYYEGGLLLEAFFFGLALSYRVHLLNKIKQKEEEHLRIQAEYEKSLAQAEMVATRMQVNPHFIFNSLGAINLLIQKEKNKKASRYLVTFSRFIRMILELPKSHAITLAEELKLIRYYLSLEEKRFDEDFSFSIRQSAPEIIDHIYIPPLLLQPFVENAIWHGLLPSPHKHKKLCINVKQETDAIKIIIEDNGVGRQLCKKHNKTHKRKSLGTKITKDRIEQFNRSFNCQINLRITDKNEMLMPEEGRGTKVILTIPKTGSLSKMQNK